jgi:type 1 glutamine amidotransferase
MKKPSDPAQTALSRRGIIGAVAAAAGAIPLVVQAQNTPAAAPTTPAAAPATRPPPQGGRGPIRVLFITKGHEFDRENLFLTLDSMGSDITWTHVEHPAAQVFLDPKFAANYDVFLFYDCYAGRVIKWPTTPGQRPTSEDPPPSPELQAGFKKLLQNGGKGFVFFHHSIASWVHSWPPGVNGYNAYSEVIGGAADWTKPIKNVRGVDYPASGYLEDVPMHITVVDKTHPVTQGVEDFDITDELYMCPMFEDSVHCLTRTNLDPVPEKFRPQNAGHPRGSNMTSWVKTAERSPIVYIQHGHDNLAWVNPNFRKLMINAIKWTASPESKAWAQANPKRIFK